MRPILLMILSVLALPASAASPDAIIEQYFTALESQDFSDLGKIIAPQRMSDIKKLMVSVVQSESRAAMAVEERVFGEPLTKREANEASADFYLDKIVSELASGANSMNFSVQKHTILGQVTEGNDQVHIVARFRIAQPDRSADDIAVYSFTKVDGQWYMDLPPILKNYLGMLEGSLNL